MADTTLAEESRLSTAPLPPVAPGRGRLRALRGIWRQLTSMRTALLLLALLALAAVPGTLLPQRGLNPVKVDEYITSHPHLGPLLDKLSLFDVFAAPWFAAIYLLLFISLVGCLVPRIRLHVRALRRRPPAAPRHLERMGVNTSWQSDGAAADVVAAAAARLRRGRWRVVERTEPDGAVSLGAEKGYLRETGNLVFHVSLVLLLVGIALGGLFGYRGTVLVVQGNGFANVRSSYDVFEPARLYSDSQLAPFSFTLDKFVATYQPDGTPKSFDAAITYRRAPTAPAAATHITVNHPLGAPGANVYLIGHGYALQLQVRDPHGRLVYDRATPFLADNATFASHGVVKVPDGLPKQLGFTGFFYPSFAATALGPASTYPAPRNPVLVVAAWSGNLGLSTGLPQSVYNLPVASLHHVGTRELRPGQTWRLANGDSLTFAGITPWATFQVTHDPGKKVVLVAAVLVIAGLLGSLRVRRRRFWLRAVPAPDGAGSRRTVVRAAGLARSDADGFAAEFESLVRPLKD